MAHASSKKPATETAAKKARSIASKVLRYQEYGRALLTTDAWRAKMADAIQFKLPAEVQNNVFEHLAVALLPDAMGFDKIRHVPDAKNRFKISEQIRVRSTLKAATNLLLSGISKMGT
ncbi:uncharacterized protein RCC_08753 [Ramularia collo-cygni]|uniref:Uncharacterized protein n=1 Tax=Ramularia collo-cygni TaxID=112498 RepID=A0A2D3V4X7_9PEZI|nr:uncharacterized protein RCC_08753 [Ramularia collo-cygni]CZT23043.1 uncharacterized protein RCC_08753 [Ramularia collo-cygni]